MAVKSITVVKGIGYLGDIAYTVNDIVLPTSSTEGGETVTLRELGFGPEAVFLGSLNSVVSVGSTSENITSVVYNGTKVIPFNETPAIVAKEKDLDDVTIRLFVFCTSP